MSRIANDERFAPSTNRGAIGAPEADRSFELILKLATSDMHQPGSQPAQSSWLRQASSAEPVS